MAIAKYTHIEVGFWDDSWVTFMPRKEATNDKGI
jgi:hypothetical protein